MLQVVRRAVGGVCVLVLVGALTVSSAAGSSDAPKPVPGAAGIGDRYFPLDGNGGYDVTHYDVHDTYAGRRLTGWTDVTATATSTLSSFHLDLVLTADTVTVDGTDAAFAQPRSHELVVTPAGSGRGCPSPTRPPPPASRTWRRGGSRPTTTRVTRPAST